MTDERLREAAKAVEVEPTIEDQSDPLFNAIWNVIKKWDISPNNDGIYSGATGTDVMAILVPLRAALEDRRKVERRNEKAHAFVYDKYPYSPEKRIATEDRRKGKGAIMAAESLEKLEDLLCRLCVGAFAVPIEEVARRIESLYRPAPDAAMMEKLKQIHRRLERKEVFYILKDERADVNWLLTTLEKLMGIGEEEKHG